MATLTYPLLRSRISLVPLTLVVLTAFSGSGLKSLLDTYIWDGKDWVLDIMRAMGMKWNMDASSQREGITGRQETDENEDLNEK